jgi:hypothetical protein
MYTHIILIFPPFVIRHDTPCHRIPTQAGSSRVQCLPLGIPSFKCIPPILHLPFIVRSLGMFKKLTYKIRIPSAVQRMLESIMGQNFFHTNIIKCFGNPISPQPLLLFPSTQNIGLTLSQFLACRTKFSTDMYTLLIPRSTCRAFKSLMMSSDSKTLLSPNL